MAKFTASFETPGLPKFSRTIEVADDVWADVIAAIRASVVDGEAYTEENCANVMLRNFVEANLAAASAIRAKRALDFTVVA